MVMRKKSLVLLVFLFSAGILFAQADTAQTAEPGIKMFVSTWSTDGAQADIQFSNGYFQVHVETFDHGYEWNEWDYLCIYDENRQALIASNTGTSMPLFTIAIQIVKPKIQSIKTEARFFHCILMEV